MSLMFHNGQILFSGGLVATDPACCCDVQQACCATCPWLYDYWFNLGQIKATFTSGPISGYIILDATSNTQQDSCLEWQTSDDTNVVDSCTLYAGGTATFWCESTGASLIPLKFSLGGLGSGGCEVLMIGIDPEFSECTDAVAPDPYGTVTLRYRWALNDLFPGGCDACGGLPQDIVIEITRYP